MAKGRFLIAALMCALFATPALADRDDHNRGHDRGHDRGRDRDRHERDDHGRRDHDRHDRDHRDHDRRDRHDHRPERVVVAPVIVERPVVRVMPRPVFVPVQREVVYNYFTVQPVHVAALPPGLARKIRRGHALPPEVIYQPAPVALVQQVPACMNGWECILAGTDMLILDSVHRTVHEVVRNVVR